jgi:hypothetical protein
VLLCGSNGSFTTIRHAAFRWCGDIVSIVIPASVEIPKDGRFETPNLLAQVAMGVEWSDSLGRVVAEGDREARQDRRVYD